MPLGEAIGSFVIEVVAQAITEILLGSIGKSISRTYYSIRKLITGKEREFPELNRIKKYYLFKKIRLKKDFNKDLPKGTQGTVMEVIDEKYLFVEFEDNSAVPIKIRVKQVLKIERSKVVLVRSTRARYKR